MAPLLTFSGQVQHTSTFHHDYLRQKKSLNALGLSRLHLGEECSLKMSWRIKIFKWMFFGSYNFMSVYMKMEKQLYPVSYSRWDSSTLYQMFCRYKTGLWKMSSVTPSLILLWLRSSCGSDTVISSNAGSWLNRLSSSGRNVLADGVARLPRQFNWHYINTLCQGTESFSEENNNSAKLIALVKSH